METYQINTFDLKQIEPDPPKMTIMGAISFDSQGNIYLGFYHKYISLDLNYNLRWKYDTQDEDISFRSTPAIDEETGRLYVGTKANEKSKFIAINLSDGSLAWAYDTGKDVYSSPSLKNGMLYFGSEAMKLHVLTIDGKFVYDINFEEDFTWASPIIDSQGILYMGGMRGFVFAVDIN